MLIDMCHFGICCKLKALNCGYQQLSHLVFARLCASDNFRCVRGEKKKKHNLSECFARVGTSPNDSSWPHYSAPLLHVQAPVYLRRCLLSSSANGFFYSFPSRCRGPARSISRMRVAWLQVGWEDDLWLSDTQADALRLWGWGFYLRSLTNSDMECVFFTPGMFLPLPCVWHQQRDDKTLSVAFRESKRCFWAV